MKKTEINNINPDLVLNLGDLVEDFNDHDKDIINLTYKIIKGSDKLWTINKIQPI